MTRAPVYRVNEAAAEWGANCGPGALAAALGKPTVDHVHKAVEPWKGYMGINDMRDSINRAGGEIIEQWSKPEKVALASTTGPVIVLINFGGPWSSAPKAAARFRHFICYRHEPVEIDNVVPAVGWVWDVNNLDDANGGTIWIPVAWWREHVLPRLIPPRGDGTTTIGWMARVGMLETAGG